MSIRAQLFFSSISAAFGVLALLASAGSAAAQAPSNRPGVTTPEKPTGAVPGPRKLSGGEIRALVTDKSARFVTGDGRISGTNVWRGSGELNATTTIFGFSKTFSGTWTVEGDRFCKNVLVDFINSRCQTVMRVSANTFQFVNEDGSIASVVTFAP
jgi:hypothetical protein